MVFVAWKLLGCHCAAVCMQTRRAGSAECGGSSEEELDPGDALRAGLSRGAQRELEQLQVGLSSVHSFRGMKQRARGFASALK